MKRKSKIGLEELYGVLRDDETRKFTLNELADRITPNLEGTEIKKILEKLRLSGRIYQRLVGDPTGDYVQMKYSRTKKENSLPVAISVPELDAY